MIPNDLTDLTNVLLTAAAAGAVLAFAYLSGQRVIGSAKGRLWAGAALVAIPGLALGWLVTQPELGVRSAYGEFSDAILGSTSPTVDRKALSRPAPAGSPSARIGTSSQEAPSQAPSVSSAPGNFSDPSGSPVPSTVPSPTPSETPSPTPTTTPSPSTSPSETPSPTPTETSPPPTPSPPGAGSGSGDPRLEPPPPAPEPSPL